MSCNVGALGMMPKAPRIPDGARTKLQPAAVAAAGAAMSPRAGAVANSPEVPASTSLGNSASTLRSWPAISATMGCSLSFSVFAQEGAPRILATRCAASISGIWSPRATRFRQASVVKRRSFMSRCLKAACLHMNGSPGYFDSNIARAETTWSLASVGSKRGIKRLAESRTHVALPLVTMSVSPMAIAAFSADSAAASRCLSSSQLHVELRIAVLQRSVSSQSKMMTVRVTASGKHAISEQLAAGV
mmetsp:Transcript_29933/g.87075  ORF Transcript_29933/g.87075 Transcript_29933/m.87075 type:complete len:246 (+) Transcript_29933:216-953(+)